MTGASAPSMYCRACGMRRRCRAAGPERIAGIVVPGMPNAHSHAFQRAMAGNTEYRLSARDSFWTWRQAMYALANRIEPRDLELLATQLFIEMLKSGYTSVAEFHYLHRQSNGEMYARANGALGRHRQRGGIGRHRSDVSPDALPDRRFRRSAAENESRRDSRWLPINFSGPSRRVSTRSVAPARPRCAPVRRFTACAPCQFRRSPRQPGRCAAWIRDMPLHIHVAEQVKEVQACVGHTGRRPIELLLETGLPDQHWCLVHATHATAAELAAVAASRAAVCLSITTEANLGDGFFDASRYLQLGGSVCVGSDSQATVCPAEELRWLEYQQRLRKRRRGVLADRSESHAGTRLWSHAARVGAQALGQPAGAIEVGRRARLVGARPRPSQHGWRTARERARPSGVCWRLCRHSRRDGGRPVGREGRAASPGITDARPLRRVDGTIVGAGPACAGKQLTQPLAGRVSRPNWRRS